MKRVSILGLNSLGLSLAILAAESGYDVFCFDSDAGRSLRINNGDPALINPELYRCLVNAMQRKNLKITEHLEYADCFVITVPVGLKKNARIDLSPLTLALDRINARIMPGNLIIIQSTLPVGTVEKLACYLEEISGLQRSNSFYMAHCPERDVEKPSFKDIVENDRVIGGICQKSGEVALNFYAKFIKGFLHLTDDKTAEMIKLVANSVQDIQIAFANQIAAMCASTHINPAHVVELANSYSSVPLILPSSVSETNTGIVDPYFLIQRFPEHSQLLQIARDINIAKPNQIIDRLLAKVEECRNFDYNKPRVLALGLATKANLANIEDSVALVIAKELAHKKDLFDFVVHDPYVQQSIIGEHAITLTHDLHRALASADIVLVLVKHWQFINIPEEAFCNKTVLDSCGLLYDIQKKHAKDLLAGRAKSSTCSFENVIF